MKSKKTATAVWQSPSEVMDTLFDVRAEGCADVGYALLRPRCKGAENSVSALIGAKLAPVKPNAKARTTRCGIPVTASDHRVVLAPGVADQPLARLLEDYDACIRPQQRLLAAVLTLRGSVDEPRHDLFDAGCGYASLHLARNKRLSSVVVLHTPGDEGCAAPHHVHICILARQHFASGWAAEHPELTDTAHEGWAEEWRAFRSAWDRLLLAA